jgi:hypothetical protein
MRIFGVLACVIAHSYFRPISPIDWAWFKMRTSHIMRTVTVLFGMSCLLNAAEPKQKVRVEHTERADFPSSGLLRLKNSVGEVRVVGWDRPDVEITTIKSTYTSGTREKASRDLDKVRISIERHGDEIVIVTQFPGLASRLSAGLEYYIKAPMSARLAANHKTGEVHVDNLTSDIHVSVHNGGITLRLPQDRYNIDARSDLGDVISDFQGSKKRKPWLLGYQFAQPTPAAHKLYLRVGFGDIMILKPSTPRAVAASSGP